MVYLTLIFLECVSLCFATRLNKSDKCVLVGSSSIKKSYKVLANPNYVFLIDVKSYDLICPFKIGMGRSSCDGV